ncbi:hypothetical protein [Caenimonas aquaedulcis]|uniref:Uncharacterized protein n=1 Tax=Caenimonas aquaedulcis TaxID=2793270 RepID=A0A931H4H7_9BURK|nr:hypothetical protein [Caenimonas aquaedulcis]MBG9388347.1 hypothetical protein [Caenimonas aquaedulcis]
MNHPQDPSNANAPQAEHGAKSEVTWDNGQGRQPYANQGTEEIPPAAGGEAEEGDRGEQSGRTLEQLAAARGKP